MSLSGLAGFAQGFGNARQAIKDRKQREADNARTDALISALGAQPAPGYPAVNGGAGVPAGGVGKAPALGAVPGNGLFGLIDATEGGGRYDTLYGYANNGGAFNGVDVSQMTLGELYDFSSPSGPYGQWTKSQLGYVATPMGRHQIVGRTLRATADGMGLSPDTKFTPPTQDAMAAYLARNAIGRAKTPAGKRAALRAEWAGFKNVPDSALDAAIADFEANGGLIMPRPMGAGPR